MTDDIPDNKRRDARQRRVRAAITRFDSPASPMPCVLLDISDGGARLHIYDMAALPDRFRLRVESDAIDESCEVIWRRGDEVGVKFLKN